MGNEHYAIVRDGYWEQVIKEFNLAPECGKPRDKFYEVEVKLSSADSKYENNTIWKGTIHKGPLEDKIFVPEKLEGNEADLSEQKPNNYFKDFGNPDLFIIEN